MLADERMRVARDLHDVVAHHLSAVAVQAGAARVLPEEAVPGAVGHMVDAARRISAALPESRSNLVHPDSSCSDYFGRR